MKNRDEKKEKDILRATIELVISEGLQGLSMSKIAKKVNISVSTIYIYYESKADLIEKVYTTVKKELGEYSRMNMNGNESSEKIAMQYMNNLYKFMKEHLDDLLFIEICYLSLTATMEKTIPAVLEPVLKVFSAGIKRGEMQQFSPEILMLYCYLPIIQLAKSYKKNPNMNIDERFSAICQLSWNAIKK